MVKRIPKMSTRTGLPLGDEWSDGFNDVTAAERARTAIADLAAGGSEPDEQVELTPQALAAAYAGTHRVDWERAVNQHGVAVRRTVARSAWEVDPDAR
jgi:hypothetical protein